MGLLRDAAAAWYNLHHKSYSILMGHKKDSIRLLLIFRPEDFPHLAGMQYTEDIDFGMRRDELRGKKLLRWLLNDTLDDSLIEKAREWERIRGRLESIIRLEATLDGDFEIYRFSAKRLPISTKIKANYVIRNQANGDTFFVFLDEEQGVGFCKSTFRSAGIDFTFNQARLTVLVKEKFQGEDLLFSYTHPHYKPEQDIDRNHI